MNYSVYAVYIINKKIGKIKIKNEKFKICKGRYVKKFTI